MSRERREFHRVPETFHAKCRRAGELGEIWKDVQTVNIGAGGMRFTSGEMCDAGDTLELELHLPAGGGVLTVSSNVIWSKVLSPGVNEAGVAFVNLTPDQQWKIDELVAFLQKHPGA